MLPPINGAPISTVQLPHHPNKGDGERLSTANSATNVNSAAPMAGTPAVHLHQTEESTVRFQRALSAAKQAANKDGSPSDDEADITDANRKSDDDALAADEQDGAENPEDHDQQADDGNDSEVSTQIVGPADAQKAAQGAGHVPVGRPEKSRDKKIRVRPSATSDDREGIGSDAADELPGVASLVAPGVEAKLRQEFESYLPRDTPLVGRLMRVLNSADFEAVFREAGGKAKDIAAVNAFILTNLEGTMRLIAIREGADNRQTVAREWFHANLSPAAQPALLSHAIGDEDLSEGTLRYLTSNYLGGFWHAPPTRAELIARRTAEDIGKEIFNRALFGGEVSAIAEVILSFDDPASELRTGTLDEARNRDGDTAPGPSATAKSSAAWVLGITGTLRPAPETAGKYAAVEAARAAYAATHVRKAARMTVRAPASLPTLQSLKNYAHDIAATALDRYKADRGASGAMANYVAKAAADIEDGINTANGGGPPSEGAGQIQVDGDRPLDRQRAWERQKVRAAAKIALRAFQANAGTGRFMTFETQAKHNSGRTGVGGLATAQRLLLADVDKSIKTFAEQSTTAAKRWVASQPEVKRVIQNTAPQAIGPAIPGR